MKKITDICYGKLKNAAQYLDVYLPDCDTFPVFVYFHGGGLVSGDKADQAAHFEYLADKGIATVSANYRMYPDAQYPDFINDAAEAVAWAFKEMSAYGNVSGIYVGGSSAGGYISQMLCFDSIWLTQYGISPLDIKGYIHDAGQPTNHFIVLRESGFDQRRLIVDERAPLYYVGIAEKYSPMLIIVSDDDLPNRYEQTMLLISTLKHFGHTDGIYLEVMHGKHCAYNGSPEKTEYKFVKMITKFINGEYANTDN